MLILKFKAELIILQFLDFGALFFIKLLITISEGFVLLNLFVEALDLAEKLLHERV